MPNHDLVVLEEILNKATANMDDVTSKKMFGCHAVWVRENVFALVWKHGRIGVKLPDEKSYQTLMATKGSDPWKAGPMTMAHWVLVPEKFHTDSTEFNKWARRAYDLCSVLKKDKKKSGAKLKK
jgi:TfoX/Sxy family transcriptional regulator of competence genes